MTAARPRPTLVSPLRASVLVLLLALLAAPAAAQTPDEGFRGTFVLVHGAWGGGWDWRPVDRALTAAGYDVYRVTLTGQGERVHLLGPDIDLTTHVQDVVNTILFERLDDVVLVGHSYGGMVVTQVADSIPERLRAVVYLDAFLPFDGESVESINGRPIGDPDAIAIGAGWVNPNAPYPRDVAHPAGTFREAVDLGGREPAAGTRGVYVLTRAAGAETDDFQAMADRAEGLGWPVHVLTADHNAQRSNLPGLVALLEEIAESTGG